MDMVLVRAYGFTEMVYDRMCIPWCILSLYSSLSLAD